MKKKKKYLPWAIIILILEFIIGIILIVKSSDEYVENANAKQLVLQEVTGCERLQINAPILKESISSLTANDVYYVIYVRIYNDDLQETYIPYISAKDQNGNDLYITKADYYNTSYNIMEGDGNDYIPPKTEIIQPYILRIHSSDKDAVKTVELGISSYGGNTVSPSLTVDIR